MATEDLTDEQRAARDLVCLALDLDDEAQILEAVDELSGLVGSVKLNSAFTLFGPSLVREIRSRGVDVFLDLKLHDIPNTLTGYGAAVVGLDVQIVTVHVSGGRDMLRAAVESTTAAAARLDRLPPKVIGIAMLTSIDRQVMNEELNIPGPIEDEVLRKATLAAECGLDGIVCSAAELAMVRSSLPDDFMFVTPGVRPAGGDRHDHKRLITHADAIRAGSRLLVVGRAVFGAPDRRAAARSILDEVAAAR